MKGETQKLLLRAKDCLDDANFNLKFHRYMVVVNRAYYLISFVNNLYLIYWFSMGYNYIFQLSETFKVSDNFFLYKNTV